MSLLASVLSALVLLSAAPLQAASMQKIERGIWGASGLPDYVNMYLYAPDKLAAKPPILVASHHCGGTAQSTWNETMSTFVSLADKQGFLIIFPEATGHNCWDVGSAKSLKHDGGGDTHAVAQMVRYALQKYAGDPSRVYAFGTSSGAMMTQALIGVYPDMFMAGVAVSGVACGCWAEQYSGDSGPNGQWSGPCAGGNVSKTAQQWGDLARAMFPGYTGHRPRVQLWHGTADTTISFKNLAESIKQWTNVLGLSESPSATDSAKAGYAHQLWKNDCGYAVLESWAQQGAGHNVGWDASIAAGFLGLDRAAGPDPEASDCAGAAGAAGSISTAGTGGMRSAAGASGEHAAGSGAMSAGRAAAASSTPTPSGASAGSVAGSAAAHAGTTAISTPSAGASAGALATKVVAQGAAGISPATATMEPAAPPNSAEPAASSGCSLFVCARGALPTQSWAVWLFGAVAWVTRCRSRGRSRN